MQEIIVGLDERQYPIRIGAGVLHELGGSARREIPECDRLLVVTHPEIGTLYGRAVLDSLAAAGLRAEILEIPAGEAHKTVETVSGIWDALIGRGCTRQSALVALGGGVVGDMTGFAAATYMRGIDFVQVPTTLLAMVDSSVGGKTGVNHPRAKNTIGSFWQPRLVFMDMDLLRTLPVEEFRSGFAEVVKHGVIRDAVYFQFLENHLDAIFALDPVFLEQVVTVSCRIKASVVEADEREAGLRAILNFGHTVGHAVEAAAHYGTVRHGECVALGMAAAARMAERLDMAPGVAQRLERLLERAGLPVRLPPGLSTAGLVERLQSDKKVRGGRVRFVLPLRIGEVLIRDDVSMEVIERTLVELGALVEV